MGSGLFDAVWPLTKTSWPLTKTSRFYFLSITLAVEELVPLYSCLEGYEKVSFVTTVHLLR